MFYLVFILLSLCLFIVMSVLGHEYGHAAMAKIVGWKVCGIRITWFGAAIKLDMNEKPEKMWKVAAGGLLGSFILFLVGLGLATISPLFLILCYLNFFIILSNIVPIKGLDGYYIFKAIKERFQRPSETHF